MVPAIRVEDMDLNLGSETSCSGELEKARTLAAADLGVHPKTRLDIESSGKRKLRFVVILDIAGVDGLSVGVLTRGQNQPVPSSN